MHWEVGSASHWEKSHRKPGQSNTLIRASSPQNGERVHAYYVSCLCRGFMWLPQKIHAVNFNEIQRKIPPWPLLVLDSQNTLENSSCKIQWRNPDKCWRLTKIRKKKSPRNRRQLVLYTDDQRGFFPYAKVFIVWCSWQGLPPSSGQLGTLGSQMLELRFDCLPGECLPTLYLLLI